MQINISKYADVLESPDNNDDEYASASMLFSAVNRLSVYPNCFGMCSAIKMNISKGVLTQLFIPSPGNTYTRTYTDILFNLKC